MNVHVLNYGSLGFFWDGLPMDVFVLGILIMEVSKSAVYLWEWVNELFSIEI